MSGSGRFLSRWSRLKRGIEPAMPSEGPASVPAAVPAAETPATEAPVTEARAGTGASPAAASPPGLPPLETLGLDSDFSAFLKKEVSESLRRAALRKLFADPRFNEMDGLDIYIDDYSVSDPIPPELMKRLRQFQTFLGDENAPPEDGMQADAPPAVDAQTTETTEPEANADAAGGTGATGDAPAASPDCDTLGRTGQVDPLRPD